MTTTDISDHLVGRVLDGRYEIVQRLARGGMATVYLATDRRLTRTVAIKVMHEGLGDDEEFARKFDREARSAARLSHPNIVSVFDQGLDGGRPYIVMEYVEGRTLRNVIVNEAPTTPARALELLEPVVAAVAAAHESGLIHRDVKPENVLISERGRVKVVDFGLAKAISGQTATATQGLLLGTVSYIAPELVTEGRPRPASDVYSIGVVLFELLTGTKPHTGENPIQVAYSHVHKSVPAPSTVNETSWRSSRSGIPPYLDALVVAATARELGDRPEDARVLLHLIRAARKAVTAGVMNDQRLTALMHKRRLAELGPLTPESPGSAGGGSSETTAPVSFTSRTPVTPVTPEFEDSIGGIPYLDTPRPQSAGPAVRKPAPVARKYRRRRIAVLVSVLLVLALVGGGGGWWWTTGRFTTTPPVVGHTQIEAQAAAEQAGLKIVFTDEFSETVATGIIISSDPQPGDRIPRDGEIRATVSKGQERYEVPPLAGLTREQVTSELAQHNLRVGKITEQYHETAEKGTVTGASQPVGARLKRDTAIDLVLSLGPKPIPVPNFTNKPYEAAKAQFVKLGFKVVIAGQENHSTVPAGSIISQNPNSGTGKKNDTITVVVSKGPIMVQVPSVRAHSVQRAEAALKAAGLKPRIRYLINNPLGLVIASNPAAGQMVPQGSTVTLDVA